MNYRDLLLQTKNQDINKDDQIVNAALGLAGEAGEYADLIKKHKFQGHDLDRAKLIKELGDVRWYLELACWALDTTVEEIEVQNIKKLLARYPNGFSATASTNRKD